jgi:hypothetical protein
MDGIFSDESKEGEFMYLGESHFLNKECKLMFRKLAVG